MNSDLITESERQNMPEWIALHKNDQTYLVTMTYPTCAKTGIWRFPNELAMARTAQDISRNPHITVTYHRIDG